MYKYIVICYSIHEKAIASYDFIKEGEDPYLFMEKDARNTYDEEINGGSEAELEIYDTSAYLSSCNKEYQWTWEVLEIA